MGPPRKISQNHALAHRETLSRKPTRSGTNPRNHPAYPSSSPCSSPPPASPAPPNPIPNANPTRILPEFPQNASKPPPQHPPREFVSNQTTRRDHPSGLWPPRLAPHRPPPSHGVSRRVPHHLVSSLTLCLVTLTLTLARSDGRRLSASLCSSAAGGCATAS